MKTFLVLAFSDPEKPQDNGGSMDDWEIWMKEADDSIVDMGSPLDNGVENMGSEFSEIKPEQWPAQGYMMIQAESMDAAIELMKSSPIGANPLRIFEKVDMC